VKATRGPRERPAPPPPLEADDRLVTAVGTAGWAVALVVLLLVGLPPSERWWLWTCATGLAMGLFALWYVPRLKRSRDRAAARRARRLPGQSAPRDNGSNTVSSTEIPGRSTRS